MGSDFFHIRKWKRGRFFYFLPFRKKKSKNVRKEKVSVGRKEQIALNTLTSEMSLLLISRLTNENNFDKPIKE